MNNQNKFFKLATSYIERLEDSFNEEIISGIESLANDLRKIWIEEKQVFICGNGGSAANSLHMANDFHYGIGACGCDPKLPGLRVEALPANSAVLTCLANDTGYENTYSQQIDVKGKQGDLLIVLSGSGNSANIVNALEVAKRKGIKTFAILGFDGGKCLELADNPIHFMVNDMQIAEDTQLIVGHLCMQWLNQNKPEKIGK